ncbi:MAG: DUF4397 domain-containing protein [Gemmatimonadetes bacterium]|nr:DUF4397 domain-containing protein [Gemmatimonadota bacterium]
MKLFRYGALAAAGALLVACDSNTGGTPTTLPPQAYVRYVNAVSDVNTIDLRFVDFVEGSPNFTGVQFRQFTPYQAVYAGTRHMTAFVSPLPYVAGATPSRQTTIANLVVDDTTVTFQAGVYYTIYHVGQTGLGFSNPGDAGGAAGAAGNVPNGAVSAGGATMYVLIDTIPAVGNPAPAQVQVRTVNLGQPLASAQGLGPVDMYLARETDANLTVVGAGNGNAFTNVPPFPAAGGRTAYATVNTRPTSAAVVTGAPNCASQTNTFRWSAATAGTAGPALTSQVSCVIGTAGTTTVNGVAGAQIPGSVLTVLLFPAGKTGSAAAAAGAAFASPLFVTMIDKNPPRTAP